ncbi:hypothetical protein GCM10029992_38000 [Glycomyces albus]
MFRLDATSPEAVTSGRFRLWLTGIPRPESSLAGRFTPFLGPETTDRLSASFPQAPGRIAAQLSFPPRRTRNGNLASVPPLLPHLIVLGEHTPEDRRDLIGLDELAVTADPTQLHLIHTTTGEAVEAHTLHALDAAVHTPPLARFLAEVSGAGRTWWGPIDLGIARTLPYLPRLRAGRTVLAPARWLLHAEALPGPKAPAAEWDRAFDAWRQRWRMPDSVAFTTGDARLPIDLGDRLDRHLLRTHLTADGKLEVAEHEPGPSWVGRACEFAIALRATEPPPNPNRPRARPPTSNSRQDESSRPPSSLTRAGSTRSSPPTCPTSSEPSIRRPKRGGSPAATTTPTPRTGTASNCACAPPTTPPPPKWRPPSRPGPSSCTTPGS